MKTEKMSFKNIKGILSRDEMKSIVAGSGMMCQASCNGQPGAWTGYYLDYKEIFNSVSYWCSNGGSYTCQI